MSKRTKRIRDKIVAHDEMRRAGHQFPEGVNAWVNLAEALAEDVENTETLIDNIQMVVNGRYSGERIRTLLNEFRGIS